MKHLTTVRFDVLKASFKDAIKHNNEEEANDIISKASKEGYNLLADGMNEEYRAKFGTSEDFDNALDEYVTWTYTR